MLEYENKTKETTSVSVFLDYKLFPDTLLGGLIGNSCLYMCFAAQGPHPLPEHGVFAALLNSFPFLVK